MGKTDGVTLPDRLIDRSLGWMRVPLVDRLWLWRERAAQRKMLARFDNRALRDIAVDRATAYAEAAKPFWRA